MNKKIAGKIALVLAAAWAVAELVARSSAGGLPDTVSPNLSVDTQAALPYVWLKNTANSLRDEGKDASFEKTMAELIKDRGTKVWSPQANGFSERGRFVESARRETPSGVQLGIRVGNLDEIRCYHLLSEHLAIVMKEKAGSALLSKAPWFEGVQIETKTGAVRVLTPKNYEQARLLLGGLDLCRGVKYFYFWGL